MFDRNILIDAAAKGNRGEEVELKALLAALRECRDRIEIIDHDVAVSSVGVLARLGAFGGQDVIENTHRLIWEIAISLGIYPASIDALYRKISTNSLRNFTVPAMNMRAIAFQSARGVFRAMKELDTGAAIFELSRGEIGFTGQRPHEYVINILCAAVAEGHVGPVFIQGDHFQVSATRYAEDPEAEIKAVEALILEAVSAGFYNIDIDTSTLVDLSYDDVDAQQKPNYTLGAHFANLVRKIEPEGVTISLGGEIGEVGEENSTIEEVNAYLNGFGGLTPPNQKGMTNLSIQSGTRHGGNVLPDGSFGDMPIIFSLIQELSNTCRISHGLAGCVQHGASMLTLDKIAQLPDAGCIEVHLAAAFLNAVYDSLPTDLVKEADDWAKENFADEWISDWSEAQFLHHARRYPIRPFKAAWWNATKCHKAVEEAVYRAAMSYLKALRVEDTRELIAEVTTHKPVRWGPPVLNADAKEADESSIRDLAS